MLKKILEKIGFIKKNKEEFKKDNQHSDTELKKEREKDNKDSNTPDDIYPLW